MRISPAITIGPASFRWGSRTFVMGILNVTPDSFTGDGLGDNVPAAVERATELVAAGADMIDIGGESTRPGAGPVTPAVELERVIPVLDGLAGRLTVPLSVDTSKSEVAAAALAAGATIVNDIHGLRHAPELAELAAEHGAALVVMANLRGVPYQDVMAAIRQQLETSCAVAARAGLTADRVIVDPGFGFGPPPADNLTIVRRLAELRGLGHPVLIGVSRKSTIGHVLGLPVEQRIEGTAALVALAIANGADIVRVHDVRPMRRVARMADAVVRDQPNGGAAAGSPA